MRVLLSVTIMVFATTALAACGDDEPGAGTESAAVDTSLPGDPEAGAQVYQRVCVACHAADGRGNGGLTGGNFVDDETRLAKGNEELLASIRDGILDATPPMPAQGAALSDQEMRDALAYIRHEFGGTTE